MRANKVIYYIIVLMFLCTISSVSCAADYHTFCGIQYGMSLESFKAWSDVNTTNEQEPSWHDDGVFSHYSTYGEFQYDLLDMKGILGLANFKDDGLYNIVFSLYDVNCPPTVDRGEDDKPGIHRAVNAYFSLIDALTNAYGAYDGCRYISKEGAESIIDHNLVDLSVVRDSLLACEGAVITLQFDNVVVRFGSGVRILENQEPHFSALVNITYWGPGMYGIDSLLDYY